MTYHKAQKIAEKIADQQGIYGINSDEFGNHPGDCKCRICFVLETTEKLRKSMLMDIISQIEKEIQLEEKGYDTA